MSNAFGGVLLVLICAAFAYYTFWTLVLVRCVRRQPTGRADSLKPLLDQDHFANAFFPSRVLAIRISVTLLVVGLSTAGITISVT
jgi:hypothetical protein